MKTVGRIITFDCLRGLAIVLMTTYHLSFAYSLSNLMLLHFIGKLAAPMFILISGFTLLLHNKKYNSPSRTIVRGFCLFGLAWFLDVVRTQSVTIDWDVIQLIGFCYVLSGIYLIPSSLMYRIIIIFTTLIPIFALNQLFSGIFSVWPFSLYFFTGYIWHSLLCSKPYNKTILLLLTVILAISIYFFNELPVRDTPSGFLFFCSVIIIIIYLTLAAEKIRLTKSKPFLFLITFGKFPLSLYFFQQLITRLLLHYSISLRLTNNIYLDYLFFSVTVLFVMFILSLVLTKIPSISVEGLITISQNKIMSCMNRDTRRN